MELKTAAEQALVSLIQSATDAMAFLKGEIPIAVKELLTYYTVINAVYAVIGLIFIVMGFRALKHIQALCSYDNSRTSVAQDDAFHAGHIPWLFFQIPAFIAGVPIFFCHIEPLLKVTLAPRIWLMEYAASLVK